MGSPQPNLTHRHRQVDMYCDEAESAFKVLQLINGNKKFMSV